MMTPTYDSAVLDRDETSIVKSELAGDYSPGFEEATQGQLPKQQVYRPSIRKPTKSARVAGFDFPLTCEEDVDRLELMVNRNPIIKNQYIKYLAINKPPHLDVVQVLYRFFEDDALSNFNWTGQERYGSADKKKAMQKYTIFNSCMLEAWSSQGVTRTSLTNSLKKALQLQSRRRYSSYHKRKRQQMLTAEK
ncbi:uncharacterized protein LOC135697494 isoform X1 [Ochlerotatus camptorhynchus]|uniref:uncharacterized protein LOC135697494 isoform X1 n=1 Tax=Ochlerotatus camptorhynchus TaxID=644619 RepID=UPI0031DB2D9E